MNNKINKIKEYSRLFLCLALVWVLLPAQAAEEKYFIWSVQGQKNTVYLVGSMHLLPERAYPLPGIYQDVYDNSGMVVWETDFEAISSMSTQMQLAQAGLYTDGRTLKETVGPQLFQRLRRVAGGMGLPIETMMMARPWFCAMTLEVMTYMQKGYRPELGMDQHFFNRAVKDGKARHHLEEINEHLSFFTTMPEDMSITMLEMTLDELEQLQEDDMLLDIWQSGNVSRMEMLQNEMRMTYPRIYHRLLSSRNDAWISDLEDYLQRRENVMVVVGALHLVGEDGLVALLRSRGYKPVQLSQFSIVGGEAV